MVPLRDAGTARAGGVGVIEFEGLSVGWITLCHSIYILEEKMSAETFLGQTGSNTIRGESAQLTPHDQLGGDDVPD